MCVDKLGDWPPQARTLRCVNELWREHKEWTQRHASILVAYEAVKLGVKSE